MREKEYEMSAPNTVSVCIDLISEAGKKGRMYCCYEKEPYCFENEWQLLKKMDLLMDMLDCPQSSVKTRSYRDERQEQRRKKPEKIQEYTEILQNRGKTGTVIIQVQYRQNATWQGKMLHVENQKTLEFFSALELLKLLDQEF